MESIKTVGDLIKALSTLPEDMPIGFYIPSKTWYQPYHELTLGEATLCEITVNDSVKIALLTLSNGLPEADGHKPKFVETKPKNITLQVQSLKHTLNMNPKK